jgi:putative transcriptional regulator
METGKDGKMARRRGKIINRVSEMAGKRRMRPADIAREGRILYDSARRLWYDDAKRLDLDTLAGLCEALDCQPGDLFEFRPADNGHDGEW